MAGKITDYTPLTTLSDGDLSDWSNFDEVSAYDSRSVSWADLKTNIQNQITFNNIYTQDGTLTGNRIVSMDVNDLTFGSTGDSNLLKFETTNDRIGIGTSTPSQKLHVVGNELITGRFEVDNSADAGLQVVSRLQCGSSSNSSFIQEMISPVGTVLSVTGGGWLSTAGNKLRLSNTGADVYFETKDAAGDFIFFMQASERMRILNTGNVGIGTATPTKKLDVIGTGVFSDQIGIGTTAPNAATKLHVVSTDAIRLETAIGGGFGHQDLISYQAGGGNNDYYRRVTSGGAALDFYKFADYARLVRDGGTIRFGINTGTSTPSATQHIIGSETGVEAFRVDSNSTTHDIFVEYTGETMFGSGTIDSSAKVGITSTTQGFLLPRMTTTQRDAISSPTNGLMIYNTTTAKANVFTTVWEAITSV